MKKIIGSFFVLLYAHLCFPQDDYKIVAVGQAGQVKDNILVTVESCGNSAQSSKNLQEIAEITRNDFSFYKSVLNVTLLTVDNGITSIADLGKISKAAVNYWVQWKCSAASFVMVGHNIRESKEVFRKEWQNRIDTNRSLVHQYNDQVYQIFFSKPSIFNSKIVFSGAVEWGMRKSIKEIYMIDFDGHNLQKITNHRGLALSPAFSPDNKKIVYSLIDSTKRIKNVALHEFDLLSRTSRVVSDKVGMNSGAVYASDGSGVYMTLSYRGNADIYFLDLKTGLERQVTRSFAEDVDASITRDGKSMAFLSNRAGQANVYVLDPSGVDKDVRRISYVGKFNATPRFSPDGSEIIFSSWIDRGFDLFRLSVSGQSLVRLTKNFGSNEDPTYSLDGQFITFTSRQPSGKGTLDQKIYIMNRDGEILGALTQNFKICSSPRLSN